MTGDGIDETRIPDPRPQPTPLWALLSRWLLALEAWLRSHGGPRLRAALLAFWGVVALAGGILLFGPVINPPLTLDDITESASHATDTWIARDFDVDYALSRTDDGHLEADVVETIDAFFPDDVEEYGIVRVLPTQYEGHALTPSGIEATMDGEPVVVSSSESSDQLTLTLQSRDPDDHGGDVTRAAPVTGDHRYVIRYRLHDLAYATTDERGGGGAVDLLAWDVFGPSWPQAFSGLDVTITMPTELDDQLVRAPRGSLAWSIVAAGEWLEPEADSPPGEVTYSFTNDQNIPPHASARFTMVFEPGTFTMPGPTPLFLLQSFGPVLPLAFLVLTLLFAFAARAVAWSDERGRPWFVSQSEPPDGVTARMAAQVLRTPLALELATALAAVGGGGSGGDSPDARGGKPGTARRGRRRAAARAAVRPDSSRADRLRAVARSARRAGRLGDRLRALLAYGQAPERHAQLAEGLRRVPTGFVRDLFIAAPLALTLLQWGLVRQLSHQATLAVVWWPAVFVLLSSAISLVVLGIALSARPLTRAGALVKQHLQGVEVFVARTSFLDRATIGDRLLPYAVLTVDPRTAGRQVAALVETTLGDPQAARGWRTLDFLSAPRILVRILAVAVLAASVTAAAVLPNPYPRSPDYSSSSGDLPGTYWNKVTAFDSAATLDVDSAEGARRATLTATEQITVDFGTESSAEVPQFARQWPTRLDGQELGLHVVSVRLDGADARYGTTREGDTVLLTTAFRQVLSGEHALEITYTVDSPIVAAPAAAGDGESAGGTVDRLRWVSLLEGWDDAPPFRDDPAPDSVRSSLTVPDEVMDASRAAGWITLDTAADSVQQWTDAVVPFGSAPPDDSGTTESQTAADGATTFSLDLRDAEDTGYPFELTVDDVGAMLDFPAGTFVGPDAGALTVQRIRDAFPLALVVALGVLALGIGVLSAVAAGRRRSRRAPPGLLRDVVWWLGTSTAVSTVWLFVWATSDMPDDWPEFPPLGLSALAALVGAALCYVFTLRRRPAKARLNTR